MTQVHAGCAIELIYSCHYLAGCRHLLQVLPIDVAKSRLQVARPGSQCDMSLLQNLRLLYNERARLHAPLHSLSHLLKAYISIVLMSNVFSSSCRRL